MCRNQQNTLRGRVKFQVTQNYYIGLIFVTFSNLVHVKYTCNLPLFQFNYSSRHLKTIVVRCFESYYMLYLYSLVTLSKHCVCCAMFWVVLHALSLQPGDFVHTLGDAHIYVNHIEPLKVQLQREPKPFPTLNIKRKVTDIDDFKFEDFEIVGYKPHPKIAMEMAVWGLSWQHIVIDHVISIPVMNTANSMCNLLHMYMYVIWYA